MLRSGAGLALCSGHPYHRVLRAGGTTKMDNHDIQSEYNYLIENLNDKFIEDKEYHENCISLTANENYPSFHVRNSHDFSSSSFYNFEPPADNLKLNTFYPRNDTVNYFNSRLTSIGNEIFGSKYFDWRPNGGETCEIATLLGLCGRGDGFVHFSRNDGGHFALDGIAEIMGINIYYFNVDKDTLLINVDVLSDFVKKHHDIKLIILDQSNKLRMQNISDIKKSIPNNVVLSYDSSHDGVFIATNLLANPIKEGADILHGSTHKTIAGPQKAYIAYADSRELCDKISPCVFPKLQSNCHSELVVNLYVALLEVKHFGNDYALQVQANAKHFALAMVNLGFKVIGEKFGYTETNQVHVVIGDWAYTDYVTRELLYVAGIRTNNVLFSDEYNMYGLRIGVQSATRRGLKECDFDFIANVIYRLIKNKESPVSIKGIVRDYMSKFKLFPLLYSYDKFLIK